MSLSVIWAFVNEIPLTYQPFVPFARAICVNNNRSKETVFTFGKKRQPSRKDGCPMYRADVACLTAPHLAGLFGGSRRAGAAAFLQTSRSPRPYRLGFAITRLVVGDRVLGDFRCRVAAALNSHNQP